MLYEVITERTQLMESTKELKRQVQDVMAQSERLVSSQTFESDFKEFKVYVEEMQNFVGEHIEDPMVLERINGLPGIELSAGSLGQGLSVAVGMSYNFV